MTWSENLFLLCLFVGAIYYFYRRLKKKSFCPQLFGDGRQKDRNIGKEPDPS